MEVYNNMECGILLFLLPLLLTHLLLVRAADDAVDSTQVKAGNVSTVNECYWSGEGPICDGKCRAGETVVSESKKNDGILAHINCLFYLNFNIYLMIQEMAASLARKCTNLKENSIEILMN